MSLVRKFLHHTWLGIILGLVISCVFAIMVYGSLGRDTESGNPVEGSASTDKVLVLHGDQKLSVEFADDEPFSIQLESDKVLKAEQTTKPLGAIGDKWYTIKIEVEPQEILVLSGEPDYRVNADTYVEEYFSQSVRVDTTKSLALIMGIVGFIFGCGILLIANSALNDL